VNVEVLLDRALKAERLLRAFARHEATMSECHEALVSVAARMRFLATHYGPYGIDGTDWELRTANWERTAKVAIPQKRREQVKAARALLKALEALTGCVRETELADAL
jgi:hypothetical protein